MTSHDLPLGRHVDYPREYDASLLFPIERALGRAHLGLRDDALPFVGYDRWHAYELSWLDRRGKPRAGTATASAPPTAPHLLESKSLKRYLTSFNATAFDDEAAVLTTIARDLPAAAGATVQVASGLPAIGADEPSESIDELDVAIDDYGPPKAEHLAIESDTL